MMKTQNNDWMTWSETIWGEWLENKLEEIDNVFRYPNFLKSHYEREETTAKNYEGRQLFELIQNADDAGEEYPEPNQMHLILTQNALYITNTGNPFSPKGIESLMISDNSPKKFHENLIGYKGLGFRSVLGWTSAIIIRSGNLSIGFSKERAKKWFRKLENKYPDVKNNDDIQKYKKNNITPIAMLSVPYIPEYFFCWDDISGNDYEKFTRFLEQYSGYDLSKKNIEKIDDRTIRINAENNSLLLSLNDEKTEVILKIDGSESERFTAIPENGKLNIYKSEKEYEIYNTVNEYIKQYDTVICLIFDKLETYKDIQANIRDFDEKTLLFLNHLEKMEFKSQEIQKELKAHRQNNIIKFNNSETWEIFSEHGKIPPELCKKESCNYEIRLAFCIDKKVEPSKLFVYLPTEINFPFALIAHATFETTPDRRSILSEESSYLFSWDEIPGNESERLIDFLKQNYSIDWVKTAKIEKIDDIKTIKVSTEKNYLTLNLNNEKNMVNLEIDDGRTDEFIFTVKIEKNSKISIYKNSINGYIIGKLIKLMAESAERFRDEKNPWKALSTVTPENFEPLRVQSVLKKLKFEEKLITAISCKQIIPNLNKRFKSKNELKWIQGNFNDILKGDLFEDICLFPLDQQIKKFLTEGIKIKRIEYDDLKKKLNIYSKYELNIKTRANIIFQLDKNRIVENKVELPELLIDENGEIIRSKNVLMPPNDGDSFPLPPWVPLSIVNSELTKKLKEIQEENA